MLKNVRKSKKPQEKNHRYNNNKIVRNPTGSPIPGKFFAKMKYSQLTALSYSASSPPAYTSIYINRPYNPLASGAHQPLGYDQMAGLYSKYRVFGMQYQITVSNRETAYQIECCLNARPTTAVHTSYDTALESDYSARLVIQPEPNGIKNFKGYVDVGKVTGVTKTIVRTDDSYASEWNASPSVTPCLTVYMINQNTDQPATCAVRIDIIYYTEWFEPKILTTS